MWVRVGKEHNHLPGEVTQAGIGSQGAFKPSVRVDDERMFFVLLEVGGADSVVVGTPCYCTELGQSSVFISSPLFKCGKTGCSCSISLAGNDKTHLTNLTCF